MFGVITQTILGLIACFSTTNDSSLLTQQIEFSPVFTCETPVEHVYYVHQYLPIPPKQMQTEEHLDGGMFVVGDVNKDGLYDIISCFENEHTYLYVGVEYGTEIRLCPAQELVDDCPTMNLVDMDGDGDLDIILIMKEFQWMENVADNTDRIFREKQTILNLDDTNSIRKIRGIKAGYINEDPWLDFLIPQTDGSINNAKDFLLISNGILEYDFIQFTEYSVSARLAFDAMLYDINQDGFDDAYVVNDKGIESGGNVMWQNHHGDFAMVDDCGCDLRMSAMGVDIQDINRDGMPDILIADAIENRLLLAESDWNWVDVTQRMGANILQSPEMSWGAIFMDHDNDGWEDILSAQGDLYYNGMLNPYVGEMSLGLLQHQITQFQDVSLLSGLQVAQGSFRNVVAVELNGDGVLDILATYVEKQPSVFLSNGCTENSWIEIVAPLGTIVEIHTTEDMRSAIVKNDSGYRAITAPFVWFGLGNITHIEKLRYKIPRQEWQEIQDSIETRRRITINY